MPGGECLLGCTEDHLGESQEVKNSTAQGTPSLINLIFGRAQESVFQKLLGTFQHAAQAKNYQLGV